MSLTADEWMAAGAVIERQKVIEWLKALSAAATARAAEDAADGLFQGAAYAEMDAEVYSEIAERLDANDHLTGRYFGDPTTTVTIHLDRAAVGKLEVWLRDNAGRVLEALKGERG